VTSQLVSSYEKALESGSERKYEVVLLNYDDDEEGQLNYVKKSKISFPTVKLDKSEKSIFSKLAPTDFLPGMTLLDADGNVVAKDADAKGDPQPAELMKILERLAENS